MRALVAVVVVVTAAIVPMVVASLPTAERSCCCADERDTRSDDGDDEGDDDRKGPTAPFGCDDRGCCVVACHAVANATLPLVPVAPSSRVDDVVHVAQRDAAHRPPGGVYRPPRA